MLAEEKTVLAFGELLWDLLPSGRVLGGAPANFAFRLKNLGVPVFLISRVGNDELGKEARSILQANGVPTEGIQTDFLYSTGTVDVKIDASGVPDFTIKQNVAYDYIEQNEELLLKSAKASVIYFGTLVQRAKRSRQTIQSILETSENALRLLDINLRRDCWTKDTVKTSLELADIVKLNDEEARVLGELYGFKFSNLKEFAWKMIEDFGLQICLVTRGAEGVYALSCDGTEADIPGIKVQVVDTIGSGDSFTAAFVKKYLDLSPLEECCSYGNQIAALVAATKGGMSPINIPE